MPAGFSERGTHSILRPGMDAARGHASRARRRSGPLLIAYLWFSCMTVFFESLLIVSRRPDPANFLSAAIMARYSAWLLVMPALFSWNVSPVSAT